MPQIFFPPGPCPICGEDVPSKALACPSCGADEKSGWKENADLHDLIPDEEFDYEEFTKREFQHEETDSKLSVLKITAIALIIIAILNHWLRFFPY